MKFLCPKCKNEITIPHCDSCGYSIEVINNIWQMTDKPNINIDPDSKNKYIGYDEIGEDFEPERLYHNDINKFRVYDSCSKKIVDLYGKDIVVLDIGAGLGSASIPLAIYGADVIAVDISQNMLDILQKRLNGKTLPNLISCRMNAYELLIPDSSVDVVVENAMLHLVDNPKGVINEILRVLKPGGKLIRYGSPGLSGDDDKYVNNDFSNKALRDITDFYANELKARGYEDMWFDNHFNDIISEYFERPYNEVTDLVEEFTEKMKFRIHRLEHKAHSGYQHVPDDVHAEVWAKTNKYAVEKYGAHYREVPNYSKYSSCLDIYMKKEVLPQ